MRAPHRMCAAAAGKQKRRLLLPGDRSVGGADNAPAQGPGGDNSCGSSLAESCVFVGGSFSFSHPALVSSLRCKWIGVTSRSVIISLDVKSTVLQQCLYEQSNTQTCTKNSRHDFGTLDSFFVLQEQRTGTVPGTVVSEVVLKFVLVSAIATPAPDSSCRCQVRNCAVHRCWRLPKPPASSLSRRRSPHNRSFHGMGLEGASAPGAGGSTSPARGWSAPTHVATVVHAGGGSVGKQPLDCALVERTLTSRQFMLRAPSNLSRLHRPRQCRASSRGDTGV
jgi:hypothetical protein